ncbi:MAG: response regulator transcription factor, partial [Thermoflexibacteraceae bacterium]
MNTTKKNRVLIVDDEPDILEMLKYNLEKEGYEVKTAADGKKALTVAKTFLPELILMDIMMPVMDGVEACRQLRTLPEMLNTYIIFLTARTEEYSEVAAFDVGADDYLTKPIKPRALMSRINGLFRREAQRAATTDDGGEVLTINEFVIDRTSYTLTKEGKEIALPKKEFEFFTGFRKYFIF